MTPTNSTIRIDQIAWEPRLSTQLRAMKTKPRLCAPEFIEPIIINPFRESFLNSLVEESRFVLSTLHNELLELPIPAFKPERVEIDISDWAINGLASVNDTGGYDLTLSLGFLLGLDDALLTVFSSTPFLAPARFWARIDDWELNHTISTVGVSCEFKGRYHDYSELRHRGLFSREWITYEMPYNIWRLRQHQLLFDLCLRWAALHEVSHAAFCHAEMLKDLFIINESSFGLTELAMDDGEDITEEPLLNKKTWSLMELDPKQAAVLSYPIARQSIELHADTFASWLGFELQRMKGGSDSLFQSYEQDMQALAGHLPDVMIRLDDNDRFRFQVLSALIVVLLFENARIKQGGQTCKTHPIPEARFINIIRSSFFGSHLVRSDAKDGFYIKTNVKENPLNLPNSKWNRFMQDGLGTAIMDSGIICDDLGLTLSLSDNPAALDEMPPHARTREEFGDALNSWWVDFLMLSSGQETKPEQMASEGGKEMARLFAPSSLLYSVCMQVQQRYRGAPIEFPERHS